MSRQKIRVERPLTGSINRGLMVLVGVSTNDGIEDVKRLSGKLLRLRLFEDHANPPTDATQKWGGKPWAKSVMDDPALSILSVSQFTLYGTIKKGTKPDFHKAAKGTEARTLYDAFLQELRLELGDDRVKDGEFGAMMDVQLVNDGPVTIVWDTNDASI